MLEFLLYFETLHQAFQLGVVGNLSDFHEHQFIGLAFTQDGLLLFRVGVYDGVLAEEILFHYSLCIQFYNQSFFLPKYPNTSFLHITTGINANIPNAIYGSTDDFGYGYGI